MDQALADLRAKWVAAQNIGCFQQLLNAETEDGKYKILAQLLSHELEQLKKAPRSSPVPRRAFGPASRYQR